MRLLKNRIVLKSLGLHSGKDCVLEIEPVNSEFIILKSADTNNELPINEFKLNGTQRGSDYIFPDGSKIRTCEHVLAAVTGCGIWRNIKLIVHGGEMPALDGCSDMLSRELMANSEDVNEILTPANLKMPVIISSDDDKRFVAAFPNDKLFINYAVEYEYVGAQIFDYTATPENFLEHISRARTFAYERDINYLKSQGLAMGGSLENAVVIGSKIQAKDGLRWDNEFVRHKILDLTGDLAAIGRPVNAHIFALRAGHELHLKLAEKLKEIII